MANFSALWAILWNKSPQYLNMTEIPDLFLLVPLFIVAVVGWVMAA
jgi:hypothetical protein